MIVFFSRAHDHVGKVTNEDLFSRRVRIVFLPRPLKNIGWRSFLSYTLCTKKGRDTGCTYFISVSPWFCAVEV